MKEEEKEQIVERIYMYAFQRLGGDKAMPSTVKIELVEQGLTEDDAQMVIDNVQVEVRKMEKERGKKEMIYGALWCVGGAVVTLLTYMLAEGGGTYVVAWGAMAWGALQFLKGASMYWKE